MKKLLLLALTCAVTTMALPADSPIEPWEYQKLLGHGFDVAWAEFKVKIEGYGLDEISAMKKHGFKTARIRTNLPADQALFDILDIRIKDCLDSGIVPILAYQGGPMEADPSEANQLLAVEWWKTVAEHYADYSHRLAFNIVVEWTDLMSKDAALINSFYEKVTPAIRQSNPTRIAIYSPKRISNPEYLNEMVIPSSAGKYVMAEWHFYAAGPSEDPASPKYWTTGTPEQKQLILDKIKFATDWQTKTNTPTWVGAWMAGNYNKGNTTPMATQIGFADYMVHVLDSVNIPWCINTIDKFYDYEQNLWIDSMATLRDTVDGIGNGAVDGLRDTLMYRSEYEQIGDTAGVIPQFGLLVSTDSPLAVASNGTITFTAAFTDAFDRIDTLTAIAILTTGDTLRVRIVDGFDYLKAGWNGKILSEHEKTDSVDDWTAYNNLWGKGTAVPGKDFRIAILSSPNGPAGSKLVWDTPSKADQYGGASVWCYTNFLWGNRQGVRESLSGFPFCIDSLESLNFTVDYTPLFGDNQFKVSLNGFLTDEPELSPFSANDGDFFMVFDQIGNWIPPYPDTVNADTSIAGKPFMMLAKDSTSGYQWRRVIIKNGEKLEKGTVDLLGLMNRFAEAGHLKKSQSIPNLQFGVEVTSGFGAIAINALSVDKKMKKQTALIGTEHRSNKMAVAGNSIQFGSEETRTVELFGLNGRKLFSQTIRGTSFMIPSNLNGIIIARITGNESTSIVKMNRKD